MYHSHPFFAPEDGSAAPPETARSFSQEEVDQLIADRLQAERRLFDAELTQQKNAREQAEEALRAHEMRRRAQEALKSRHLPDQLLDTLNLKNEQTLAQTLQASESAFRAALEEGVRERLRGAPPGAMPLLPDKPLKPKPLSYQEAAMLYQNDRAAYDKRYGGK